MNPKPGLKPNQSIGRTRTQTDEQLPAPGLPLSSDRVGANHEVCMREPLRNFKGLVPGRLHGIGGRRGVLAVRQQLIEGRHRDLLRRGMSCPHI